MYLNSRKIDHNLAFFSPVQMEGDNNEPKYLTIFVLTCNKPLWTTARTDAAWPRPTTRVVCLLRITICHQ